MNKLKINPEYVSKSIENYIISSNCSYIEATVHVMEKLGMEYNIIAKLLSKPIVEKIKEEGRGLNLLPKTKNKLPF
jgi:uncharacterized Zn finger protein